ncbi:hypothetical protein HZS_6002 [Henneguya salminicola]|uniref:Forkhead box protein O (Trinotate prediction) n=1 Tax=Henneguya salminicola TaxID=69463 RepID=A0A6G3MES8_HENSL|nr:hypothetical protein HZS_6002 [Henneguya salminicola]
MTNQEYIGTKISNIKSSTDINDIDNFENQNKSNYNSIPSNFFNQGFSDSSPSSFNENKRSESKQTSKIHRNKRYRNAWGNLSYANLIAASILSSSRRKMKLSEIYSWFTTNIPYFSTLEDDLRSRGWKNSIRHNLSLKKEFVRETGDRKAGYWYVEQKFLLERLRCENRQINDPHYNKDMEMFELYVHQLFSNDVAKVEDFIEFTKNISSSIKSVHKPVPFSQNTYSYKAKKTENPFYLLNNSKIGITNETSGGVGFESELSGNETLSIQGNNNYCEQTIPYPTQTTINYNNFGCSEYMPSSPYSMAKSSVDTQRANVNTEINGNSYGVSNALSYGSLNDLICITTNNPYLTNSQANCNSLLSSDRVEENHGIPQFVCQQDSCNGSTPMFTFTNYNFPVQSYDVLQNQQSTPGFYQPMPSNFVHGGLIQKNYNTIPFIVNGNGFGSDVNGKFISNDLSHTLIKM